MESRTNLNEALQIILDYLNEDNLADGEVKLIEAENEQLRREKNELMTSLKRYSTSASSTVIISDMLAHQTSLNEAWFTVRERAEERCKDRSLEASAQISCWEQKSNDLDHLINLPQDEVQRQIVNMKQKIAAYKTKMKKLNQEYMELNQNQDQEDDEEILKLHEILKRVEEDQWNLRQKLRREAQK